MVRLLTRKNSDRKNSTQKKTPKQNGLFMGFPGTFTRSKTQLRSMRENQAVYGPNGPGNQALGRSASMLTRKASRGRYSAKLRSPLYYSAFFCYRQKFCEGASSKWIFDVKIKNLRAKNFVHVEKTKTCLVLREKF